MNRPRQDIDHDDFLAEGPPAGDGVGVDRAVRIEAAEVDSVVTRPGGDLEVDDHPVPPRPAGDAREMLIVAPGAHGKQGADHAGHIDRDDERVPLLR